MRIAVDLPEIADSPRNRGDAATDSIGAPGCFSLSHRFFSLWLRGLPENADRGNVKVEFDGRRQRVDFVGPEDAEGLRQVNVLAAENTRPGKFRLVAEFARSSFRAGGDRSYSSVGLSPVIKRAPRLNVTNWIPHCTNTSSRF